MHVVCSSNFFDNHVLLGGSALGLLSRARVDIASFPAIIENW